MTATTRTAEQSHLTALAERDALTAQVEALTAQLAQAKAARRGATDLFELACERAERAEAKAADLADRLDDAYTMLAVAGTAPEPWLRDTADRLRGVDQ